MHDSPPVEKSTATSDIPQVLQDLMTRHRFGTARTSILIDGANFNSTCRNLDLKVDYEKLHSVFHTLFNVVRIYYFQGVPNAADIDHRKVTKFVTWMDLHGFTVVTREANRVVDEKTGLSRIKCNLDTVMVGTALTETEASEIVVLFTGDGDFVDTVMRLRRQGKRVVVVSSDVKPKKPGQGVTVSFELKKQADFYIDLEHLKDLLKSSTDVEEPTE